MLQSRTRLASLPLCAKGCSGLSDRSYKQKFVRVEINRTHHTVIAGAVVCIDLNAPFGGKVVSHQADAIKDAA